jgi:hypothetical protein
MPSKYGAYRGTTLLSGFTIGLGPTVTGAALCTYLHEGRTPDVCCGGLKWP